MGLPSTYISNSSVVAYLSTNESSLEKLDEKLRLEREATYPLQVWYFHASFIFLVAIINWVDQAVGYFRARRQQRRLAQVSLTGLSQDFHSRGSIDLLRLPLAVTDTCRALSFRWTIAIGRSYSLNFMQVFLLATYIIVLFGWDQINVDLPQLKRIPRDWGNLTGRIAAIQIPLVVALGMKNNIISLLTGVSFEKLNYLHRMTARVTMVLGWFHAGTRVTLWRDRAKVIADPNIRAGVLSAAALTLLCIVSIRPIRGKVYELFLVTHLLLAMVFIFSIYFHNASQHVGYFIWPAILLWALDRVIRVCRLAISFFARRRVPATGSESAPKISSSPRIELLSGHVMRLTTPRPKFFHWRPGQSAYLTVPKISKTALEGHPFTISTIDAKSSPTAELKFLIQGQAGFTKRLYNSDGTHSIGNVLIDGPYSTPPRLVGYDSVLLIAGSTGITFVLPLLLDLLDRSKHKGIACRRLILAWAIRHLEHTTWIKDELLAALKDIHPNLTLEIHIFVSKKTPNQTDFEGDPEKLDDDTDSSTEKENSTDEGTDEKYHVPNGILSLPVVKIHEKRANLSTFIEHEVALAQDCMSVNVCGSEMLSRGVREAIRKPRMVDILRGGPTISLHIESFQNN